MGKAEGEVENYLRTKALENHYLCYKFTSPSTSGVPDRILIGFGNVIFVETKSETGKTRRLQEVTIEKMQKHGADVRVINTKKLVDELFDELTKKQNSQKIYLKKLKD